MGIRNHPATGIDKEWMANFQIQSSNPLIEQSSNPRILRCVFRGIISQDIRFLDTLDFVPGSPLNRKSLKNAVFRITISLETTFPWASCVEASHCRHKIHWNPLKYALSPGFLWFPMVFLWFSYGFLWIPKHRAKWHSRTHRARQFGTNLEPGMTSRRQTWQPGKQQDWSPTRNVIHRLYLNIHIYLICIYICIHI